MVYDYRIGINPAPIGEEDAMSHQYGIIGIPTTSILDREGIIRHKIIGQIKAAGIFKLLSVIE